VRVSESIVVAHARTVEDAVVVGVEVLADGSVEVEDEQVRDRVAVFEVERVADEVRRAEREVARRDDEEAVRRDRAREERDALDEAVARTRAVAEDDVRDAVERRARGAGDLDVLVEVGAGVPDAHFIDRKTRRAARC
jgi:DNA topoisomerase VI subunit B